MVLFLHNTLHSCLDNSVPPCYDGTMLEILKETTVWNTDFPVANHTYLLDGDKLIAYAKFGSDEIVISKTPIKISKRYRTFVRDSHIEIGRAHV